MALSPVLRIIVQKIDILKANLFHALTPDSPGLRATSRARTNVARGRLRTPWGGRNTAANTTHFRENKPGTRVKERSLKRKKKPLVVTSPFPVDKSSEDCEVLISR